jgi:argininosuccinate lyase
MMAKERTMSEKVKKAASKRLKKMTALAKKIMTKEDISWKSALKKAGTQVKKNKVKAVKVKKSKVVKAKK